MLFWILLIVMLVSLALLIGPHEVLESGGVAVFVTITILCVWGMTVIFDGGYEVSFFNGLQMSKVRLVDKAWEDGTSVKILVHEGLTTEAPLRLFHAPKGKVKKVPEHGDLIKVSFYAGVQVVGHS